MSKTQILYATAFALLSTCTQKQTVMETPLVPAHFDYSPPTRANPGSTNMTIALLKPQFVGSKPEYYVPPFDEMAKSMANDFEELLTAKGFTIKGPFGSRDEMVYNDKVTSDFTLEVSIDLNPQYNRKYTTLTNWGTLVDKNENANFYKMTGEVALSGNLVITASSPQYGEKLWKKNIALQQQSFTYIGSAKWRNVPSMADELKQDNAVYNTVSRQLEQYYSSAFNLAWQQLDPAEMKTIAAQAKRADKK